MINRRSFLAFTAAGSLAALAGCTTGPTASSTTTGASASSTSSASASGPVTITHALGTTTINGTPKKIVTVGWGEADILVALGVAPIAAPAITWGGNAAKSTDWFDAALAKMGGQAPQRFSDKDGTPVDAIAALQPDLIVGTNSGMTAEVYAKLAKIAPTIAYPKAPYVTSWEESTKLIAQALGRAADGDKLITDTNAAIKDAVAKYPALAGKTASWIYFTPTNLNTVGIYTPLDARPRTLASFGLKDGAGVTALTTGAEKFFIDLSAEKAASIDSNVVIFDQLTGADAATVKANALLGKIPALKNDAFVALTDQQASEAMAVPTPLSLPVAFEKFLPLLAAAAAKAK